MCFFVTVLPVWYLWPNEIVKTWAIYVGVFLVLVVFILIVICVCFFNVQLIYCALFLPDFVIHIASAYFTDVCWPLWPKKCHSNFSIEQRPPQAHINNIAARISSLNFVQVFTRQSAASSLSKEISSWINQIIFLSSKMRGFRSENTHIKKNH